MIEASPALDGGVDHVDSVRHRDDQYLVLHGLRDAPQELSHLFDAVMARSHFAVSKKRLHLVDPENRSEEHTSELQSLMRISYAVFCLKKKQTSTNIIDT